MSRCRCCSVWPRILSTARFWTEQLAVTPPWSRCAWWRHFLSPPIPPLSTAQPNPSTLCWGRPTSLTDWRSMVIAPSVSRWDKRRHIFSQVNFIHTWTDTWRYKIPCCEEQKCKYSCDVHTTCAHISWCYSPLGQSSPASCCSPCDISERMDPVAAYHHWQQVSWEIYFCHAFR